MHELAPLIYDLAIMLGVAGIVVLVFERIRQPIVLGYLIAGMILGPHTPPQALVNDVANIQILSELGVIFLMFSLGLEFSFKKLVRVGFSASVTGILEVILMLIIGYCAGTLLGYSHYDCLFLGAALSISSTTIIIQAIDELHLKTKRFAELIFGVLIIEDLLAILLLVALSTAVLTNNIFSIDILIAAIKLIVVVGGWFLIGYFVLPPLFRKIAGYISQDTLTIISVALCLFLVCVAAKLHYSTALGAFIMGSILAETVLIHRIEKLVRPIRDIFAAVFFISIGMLINPIVIIQHWPVVFFIAFITILGKILTTSVAALLTGQSPSTSVRVGFSMAQVGEFSFIIVGLGESLNVTSNVLYPVIVAVSVLTTFTTPYLIRASGHISASLDKMLPERTKYFLASYSAWLYRLRTVSDKTSATGSITLRLFINGIIVAVIFTLVDRFLSPELLPLVSTTWLIELISLFIAVIAASPFIWGMLFSYRAGKIPEYAKTDFTPVVFLVWLVTLSEIGVLSIFYFETWITVVLFAAIGVLFFIFSYKHLEWSYRWFERQLVSNIGKKSTEELRYEELAPWDTHLVEVEVSERSTFVGKTLGEIHVRENYEVNVVAICHGSRVILAPRGEEKIVANDKLIVLGNDRQIEAFRADVESTVDCIQQESFLENFTLTGFVLNQNHPAIGKTIRDSGIRESMHGLVVGLERGNKHILNPDPDTVLKAEDLILLVGEVDKIKRSAT